MAEGLSERAACRLADCPRRTFQYRLRRSDDPEIVERMRAIAAASLRLAADQCSVAASEYGSTTSACGGSINPSSFRCALAKSSHEVRSQRP
jgi:hypothetical protein